MVVLVQLPEIMEKDKYEQIISKCPKFTCDRGARIAEEKYSHPTEYKILKDYEYFIDEVQKVGEEFQLADGTIISSYDVYERPKEKLVALIKNFALVDIEEFAQVAEGMTVTIVEAYNR